MKNIRAYRKKLPRVHKSTYVDETVLIIGDVVIEEDSSVYPGTVIRGDEDTVTIERGCQILDKVFIEAPRRHPVIVEEKTIIDHGAILHGCEVGEGCMIGIGAIIMEDAKIGDDCIIGAGSLVPAGMEIEPRSLMMGMPVEKKRKIGNKDLAGIKKAQKTAKKRARTYKRLQDQSWNSSYIH